MTKSRGIEQHERESTKDLPTIRPCKGCGRMTRPSRRLLADHPGTIVRKDAYYCQKCKDEMDRAAGLPARVPRQTARRPKEDGGPLVLSEITDEALVPVMMGLNRFRADRAARLRRKENLARVMQTRTTAVRTAINS